MLINCVLSIGQIIFGLVVSKVHNPPKQLELGNRSASGGLSNLTYVFGTVLLLNGAMTLGFAHAPVPSYLNLSNGREEVLIFSTTAGRAFAAICFFLGITDGAFMTLMGPMLEHYLDEVNFPAGLGIALCFTGAFNLAGTLIGGKAISFLLYLFMNVISHRFYYLTTSGD